MAELLSIRLSEVNFKYIYSSDLIRTKQTLDYITNENEYIKSNTTQKEIRSDLREKNCGVYEGKSVSLYRDDLKKLNKTMREFKPEGGESWLEVYIRAKTFMNELIITHVKKDFIEDESSNIVLSFENKVMITNNNGSYNKNMTVTNRQSIGIMKKKYISSQNDQPFQRDNTISKGLVEDSFIDNVNSVNNTKNVKKIEKYKLKQVKFEYFFLTKDVKCDIKPNKDYIKRIKFNYNGYNIDNILPRILIMSHSGFIHEFLNVIRQRKGISFKYIHESKFTCLYVIKIYCIICGGVCYSKSKECHLEYDVIVYNSTSHFGKKIEIDKGNEEE